VTIIAFMSKKLAFRINAVQGIGKKSQPGSHKNFKQMKLIYWATNQQN